MAVDLSFAVREAGVVFLRASGPVTALIPASSIYGQDVPPNRPYPHIQFGAPGAVPLEYSCVNGSTVTMDVHVFAENEAECNAIAAEIVEQMDGRTLNLEAGRETVVRWTGGQTMRDPEDEQLWHAVRTFDFEAME